jgi:FixJ family two-component response regulator
MASSHERKAPGQGAAHPRCDLPGMIGPELQARLIDDGYCAPIIFLTGRFDEMARSRVLRAGALACPTKRGNEKELTDCIIKGL